MSSEKKTAVVIGATGNLGQSICKELESLGFWVDPIWTSENRPDATKLDSYKALPKKIDAAIYVAGINLVSPAEKITAELWDKVFDVNLKGALFFAQSAFSAMKESKNSSFITISSIMTTHPYPNRLPYAASKAGLEAMTRCLAVEWGKFGISTHSLRLGHITGLMKTTVTNPKLLEKVKELVPSGKLTEPAQVASYIGWLASGGCKAVNGTVIDFDPAYTINRWPLQDA